tara:strand:- start:399 stop:1652 length:1254 start_codon:yes stop_codon:yes gene_type:complete
MKKAIEIENLSKTYDLGLVGTGTLSKDLNRLWAKMRRKPDPYATIAEINDRTTASKSGIIYALKGINFSVEKGEVLGIIGKNGAGKSTLLKILSEITSPTTGQIKMNGRVASLLEVGTGMHPEMTARQNIFLNGSLMGMRRNEINSKLDEIIDFAGILKYVDTPIKRFSSGMQVRLGFAIAAFLEPEILIVDEVLAVGDAEFQKKAIGKMKEVSKGEGRTVLFVSHNMASVKALCNTGLVINNGGVIHQGTQNSAIEHYLDLNHLGENDITYKLIANENIKLISSKVYPKYGDIITTSSGINFEIIFYNHQDNINLDITFELRKLDDTIIFHQGSVITKNKDSKNGEYIVNASIDENILNAEKYFLKVIFGENQRYELLTIEKLISFEVINESTGTNFSKNPGIILPNLNISSSFKL